jgi:hypothetical protein
MLLAGAGGGGALDLAEGIRAISDANVAKNRSPTVGGFGTTRPSGICEPAKSLFADDNSVEAKMGAMLLLVTDPLPMTKGSGGAEAGAAMATLAFARTPLTGAITRSAGSSRAVTRIKAKNFVRVTDDDSRLFSLFLDIRVSPKWFDTKRVSFKS